MNYTVADLITFLQQLPGDTSVEVVINTHGDWGDSASAANIDLPEKVVPGEYLATTNVEYSPSFKTLILGLE